jgi:hypothetical protein
MLQFYAFLADLEGVMPPYLQQSAQWRRLKSSASRLRQEDDAIAMERLNDWFYAKVFPKLRSRSKTRGLRDEWRALRLSHIPPKNLLNKKTHLQQCVLYFSQHEYAAALHQAALELRHDRHGSYAAGYREFEFIKGMFRILRDAVTIPVQRELFPTP